MTVDWLDCEYEARTSSVTLCRSPEDCDDVTFDVLSSLPSLSTSSTAATHNKQKMHGKAWPVDRTAYQCWPLAECSETNASTDRRLL